MSKAEDDFNLAANIANISFDQMHVAARELERLGWKIVGPEPSREQRIAVADKLRIPFNHVNDRKIQRDFHAHFAASPSVDEMLEGEK